MTRGCQRTPDEPAGNGRGPVDHRTPGLAIGPSAENGAIIWAKKTKQLLKLCIWNRKNYHLLFGYLHIAVAGFHFDQSASAVYIAAEIVLIRFQIVNRGEVGSDTAIAGFYFQQG